MRRSVLLVPFLGLSVLACSPPDEPRAAAKAAAARVLDGLLGVMRDRLEVMHDVARFKWAAKVPIEDAEREAMLLREVVERGERLGLDPEDTRAFFEAQIQAAKLVQRADLRRWDAERSGPGGEPPDLTRVLRPRIDALNHDLLAALAKTRKRAVGTGPSAEEIRSRAEILLDGRGVDAEVRAAAIEPLLRAASRQVEQRGR